MNKFFYIPLLIVILVNSNVLRAQEINNMDSVLDEYVISPRKVADIQISANKQLEYMLKHYSTPELAKYAIDINNSDIKLAKLNGEKLPNKLSKEILNNREKIAEYLKSRYQYKY